MQTRPILLVPLLLTLPFAAYAVPIPGTAILVEYEGRVTDVRAAPDYAVGDPISGRLFIDQGLGSFGTIGPNEATYGSDHTEFVTGFWPTFGDGFDRVFIGNEVSRPGSTRPIDVFIVEDWFVSRHATLDGAQVFAVNAQLHGLTGSNKLTQQSFEVTSADVDEPGESLSGDLRFSNIGPFGLVSFIIDRLNVKPNVCRP
jgi:hypothetical protein